MQTLYEVDSTEHPASDVLRRHIDEQIADNDSGGPGPIEAGAQKFASTLVEGVLEHRDQLDRIIAESAPSWPLDQMSKIDKSILRLAIFEILFDNKAPLKAAINEAVELGKRFGSDSSSRFINGVLGTVADQQSRWRKSLPKDLKAKQNISKHD